VASIGAASTSINQTPMLLPRVKSWSAGAVLPSSPPREMRLPRRGLGIPREEALAIGPGPARGGTHLLQA